MDLKAPKGWPATIAEAWRQGGGFKRVARMLLIVLPIILLAWAFDDRSGPALVDQWGEWGRPLVIAAFLLWGLIVLTVL